MATYHNSRNPVDFINDTFLSIVYLVFEAYLNE